MSYTANQPIKINGVLAFAPGDSVPDASVEEHGWHDLVDKVSAEPKPRSSKEK